jgi:hypothetical protein
VTSSNRLSGNSTDAKEWAETFCGLFGIRRYSPVGMGTNDVDDELGVMLGWFANAIETGRMAGEKKTEPLNDDLKHALRVIMILVQKLGGEVHITEGELLGFNERGRLIRWDDLIMGGFHLAVDATQEGPALEDRWIEDEEDEEEDDDDDDDYDYD